MSKITSYFYPNQTVGYFDNLRIYFLMRLVFGSIFMLPIFLLAEILTSNSNITTSALSTLSIEFFLFISLFVLKSRGIKIAGNILSLIVTCLLLFWMNIIQEDISVIYKFLQGFYSIYALLVLTALLASRQVLLLNATLTLISTTHVLYYALTHQLVDTSMFITGYINHTIILLLITAILFYINKFTESAIAKANRELEIKEEKNQELLSSEEEIRASNEELVATTDSLKESNDELIIVNEKAKESDRLKSEFLNNISHEVRTPMNGILGFSELLISPNINDEEKEQYYKYVSDSSTQLLKIIDDIINISRLETKQVAVNMSDVNINKLLETLLLEYKDKIKNSDISFNINNIHADESMKIFSDKAKLYTILSCFVDNAIKYTNKGSITIGSNLSEIDNLKLLQLYVKDTGIGIDDNKKGNIFTKFSQGQSDLSREHGGLGIGLSIAKENAILIGADIDFESTKGKGSFFYLNIPLCQLNSNDMKVEDSELEF